MALVTHRDPFVVGAALAAWIAAQQGLAGVRVVHAEHPAIGYSSETVLVDLAWPENGESHQYVVRLAPPVVGTFRDYDLSQQTVAQLAAASAGVAIATPELVTDLEWLGVPFIVMPRVQGHIISEVAAFDPWLLSLAEGKRAQVHESFVTAVAATHRADLTAATGVPRPRQRSRARLLGRLPRLVERGCSGSRTRRRARVVSRAPAGRGIRSRAALG